MKPAYTAMTLIITSLFLWGCFGIPRLPKLPDVSTFKVTDVLPPPDAVVSVPGNALVQMSWLFTWIGGVAILGSIVLGIVLPGAFAKKFPVSLFAAGICLILLAFGLEEMGQHPMLFGIFGVFILLAGGGYVVRKKLQALGAKQ